MVMNMQQVVMHRLAMAMNNPTKRVTYGLRVMKRYDMRNE
jgi:predicted transcriptional regulator